MQPSRGIITSQSEARQRVLFQFNFSLAEDHQSCTFVGRCGAVDHLIMPGFMGPEY